MSKKPWIKAIDTEYNGMLFRSRLEARWAVFFDAAGIKYEYEPEGFEHDGVRYLPDFYLRDFDMYVEVKPDRKGFEKDIDKCWRMIYWGGPIKRILFLGNIPGPCDGGSWNFPVIFYSSDSLDGDCVKSSWLTFNNMLIFDDNMNMCPTHETTITILHSNVYRCPLLNYCGDIIGMYDTKSGNHLEASLCAKSDYMLDEKHRHTKQELDKFEHEANRYVLDALKKARTARFEFNHK